MLSKTKQVRTGNGWSAKQVSVYGNKVMKKFNSAPQVGGTAKPVCYPYITTSETPYNLDPRFTVLFYNCITNDSSIVLPDLTNLLNGLAIYIKRSDATDNTLTVNAQLGQTTNIGDSVELSASEELYMVATSNQWEVFRGGVYSLQSVRFLEDATPTEIGAIVYNTNAAFMSGVGYYGVNSLGAWVNLSDGITDTVTTTSPLIGDGSLVNPVTLESGVNGSVLQYNGTSWVQGQFLTGTTYVDSVNGNDVTAQLGNPLFPYATLMSAVGELLTVAASGSSVYVRAGTYSAENLMPLTINWYFEPGTTINCTGPIFQPTDNFFGTVKGGNFVLASGIFINDAGVFNVGSSALVDIDSLVIDVGSVNVVQNQTTIMTFNANYIQINGATNNIFYSQNQLIVNVNQVIVAGTNNNIFALLADAIFMDIDVKTVLCQSCDGLTVVHDVSLNSAVNLNLGSVTGANTNSTIYLCTNAVTGGLLTSTVGSTNTTAAYQVLGSKQCIINDGSHTGTFTANNITANITATIGNLGTLTLQPASVNSGYKVNMNLGTLTYFNMNHVSNTIINIGIFLPNALNGSAIVTNSTATITFGSVVTVNQSIAYNITNSHATFSYLSPYVDALSPILFQLTNSTFNLSAPSFTGNNIIHNLTGSLVTVNVPIITSNGFYTSDANPNSLTIINSIIRDSSNVLNLLATTNTVIIQEATMVATTPITSSVPNTPVYIYIGLTLKTANNNTTYPILSPLINAAVI